MWGGIVGAEHTLGPRSRQRRTGPRRPPRARPERPAAAPPGPPLIPVPREEGVMKVLLSHDVIQARVVEMGRDIARDYAGREPHLVGVLKGACSFMTDLSRAIDLSLTLDYIAVSSYGAATKSS